MKKTIPLGSRKAGALALILALGLATEVANADFTLGTPADLGPTVNSSALDPGLSLSADGLALFFACHRLAFGSLEMTIYGVFYKANSKVKSKNFSSLLKTTSVLACGQSIILS